MRFNPSISDVITLTAESSGVTVDEIKGPRRFQSFVDARSIICRLAIDTLGFSASSVGRSLGGRDHRTIANVLGRWSSRFEDDAEFASVHSRTVNSLVERILASRTDVSHDIDRSAPV
ncbi:MAG: helix-turn-helix domain-containing protein [Paracoccaceae bacterium]